jgi:phosphohistidine swiveling domain-containing protein
MGNKIWVCDDEGSARYPIFTRGNAGEVYGDVASPLGWTTYGRHSMELGQHDALCETGVFTPEEFKPAGQCEASGCLGGYIYMNASVARVVGVRIPGPAVEAIDAAFFGDFPDAPPYRPDPRDRNAERTAAAGAWLRSLFTADPKALIEREVLRVDAGAARQPEFAQMSNASLLECFRSLIGEIRRLVKAQMLNAYGCTVLTGTIAQLARAAGAGHLAAKVTAGLGDVDSASHSFELWEVSRQARSSPVLSAAFHRGVDGLLEGLHASGDPAAKQFLARWDAFIGRWGFLGPSVWEMCSPTYRTNPEIPLRMLERARHAPDSSSPAARSSTLIAEREAAIAEISGRLAGDARVRGQFMKTARGAGNYLPARERGKLHITRLVEEARAPLRALGQRLANQGFLQRWEHLLLVNDDEADAFVADPEAHAGLIAERAALLEVLMSKEPPFVFEGDPPPLSAYRDRGSRKVETAEAGTELKGIGASPVRYTGRARVITTLAADSDLEPGEVIVAVASDASWGPLFLAAGAVVMEIGSAISHAAIISREIGIPATVSVAGATRRIREGSTITVDGNTGTVTVH